MNSSSGGDPRPTNESTSRLLLDSEQAEALFPFHILIDRSMRVIGLGRTLSKIVQDLQPGVDLRDHFDLERPQVGMEFDGIASHLHSVFLLKSRRSQLKLRGQMMLLDQNRLAYLASPWLPEPGALRSIGLRLQDFPIHDAVPELVQVIQSQRLAMQDLHQLTERLRRQRESLRQANEQLRIRESEARRLAMIAARTENGVVVTDARGRVEWINEGFTKLTGYSLAEMAGKTPGSVLQGPDSDPDVTGYIREQLREGKGFQCELVNYSKAGRKYWVSIEVQPIFDQSGAITNYMAIESDITVRKEWELRSRLSYSVTRVLAEITDPAGAVVQILKAVCAEMSCQFGAIWRINEATGELFCQNYWSDPSINGSSFMAETQTLRFLRGRGLPGTVWERNTAVCLPDLVSESNFPRAVSASYIGLTSGFAFPIRLSGGISAVMEFFSRKTMRPSDGLLETLTSLGTQIEQVLVRREAERQSREVLALLDSTLESSLDGFLVTDLSGLPVRANQRYSQIWRVPPDLDPISDKERFFEWVYSQLEEPEAGRRMRVQVLADQNITGTTEVKLKDGRVLEIATTPHRMSGEVVGRVWTYRDITETYRLRQVRERLLARLNATLEATTDGILVHDLDGHVVTLNQRFLEMWQIPVQLKDETHFKEVLPYVLPQLADPDATLRLVESALQSSEESSLDVVHFRDGRVFERSSHPERIGDKVIGRVWSFRDVTQRWRDEQALRESEARYRLVMESANDVILTVDERGIIVFASRSAGRLFGYPPEKLPGMLIWRLVPPELRNVADLREAVRRSTQRHWRSVEVEALRSDGSRVPVEMSLHRSRIGERRFVTGVLRDISQRREAEQRLREALQAADSANQAKSDFLANISHEIRTPLNSIVGLTEILRETQLDPDQQQMLRAVWASSESLLYLINDLLDISKIEAGQIDIDSSQFDPAMLCEQVMDILSLRASRKQLALYLIVAPAGPPALRGDPNRIRQVLLNLMGNALKFTERGSITLRLAWQRGQGARTLRVRFSVEDTGIGIPRDRQNEVFEKFYRVDTPIGRRAGGAGLGLSISRLLCEAMGGELTLVSAEGEGSNFSFELELPAGEQSGQTVARQPIRGLLLAPPEKIEPERAALLSSGITVEAFSNAEEACRHADNAAPYELFILDEQSGGDPAQIRFLARLAALGQELRCLRIRQGGAAERSAIELPGRSADLDFPLTPARIARAVAQLSGSEHGDPGSASARLASDRQAPLVRAKVLLVEDNLDSQAYALRVLSRAGCEVSVAGAGAEAIQQAKLENFDVVLMDVMLPDMTGFDAALAIRRDERAGSRVRTPIVALTAHALQDFRREAFESDMDDYVTKPVRPDALLGAVRKWTGSNRNKTAEESGAVQGDAVESVAVSADLADLVPGYLESVQSQLSQIQDHAKVGNLEQAARLAHNLKGTGRSYGFDMISESGLLIEQAARSGDASEAARLAAELSQRLSRIQWKSSE